MRFPVILSQLDPIPNCVDHNTMSDLTWHTNKENRHTHTHIHHHLVFSNILIIPHSFFCFHHLSEEKLKGLFWIKFLHHLGMYTSCIKKGVHQKKSEHFFTVMPLHPLNFKMMTLSECMWNQVQYAPCSLRQPTIKMKTAHKGEELWPLKNILELLLSDFKAPSCPSKSCSEAKNYNTEEISSTSLQVQRTTHSRLCGHLRSFLNIRKYVCKTSELLVK